MRLSTDQVHFAWDNSLSPAVSVTPGDRVELDTLDASAGQLGPASVAADIAAIDFARVNPVTGPIEVSGAQPGDALVVRILSVDVEEWGWSAAIPGFGLLADDFPEPEIVHARTSHGIVELPFGPRLPSVPMLGTLGVALPDPGRIRCSHRAGTAATWTSVISLRARASGFPSRCPARCCR